MAKQQPTKKSNTGKANDNTTIKQPIRKASTQTGSTVFNKLEKHFANKQTRYLIAIIFLAAIFSFLSFDNKISIANDDALYIEAGANYAKNFFGYFYTETAPLYPMLFCGNPLGI